MPKTFSAMHVSLKHTWEKGLFLEDLEIFIKVFFLE